MGYPMSWKRLINRNRLGKGGYDDVGESGLVAHVWTALPGFDPDGVGQDQIPREIHNEQAKHQIAVLKLFLGDLRRLETDAIDEKSTCWEIARRTGIDQEIVAAVLKEFFDL